MSSVDGKKPSGLVARIGARLSSLHGPANKTDGGAGKAALEQQALKPFVPGYRGLSLDDIRALARLPPPKPARPVRCRFAPSPTGSLHIGGGRTALMNYLYAKKMGGEFVLRIEDTDLERSKPEHTKAILDGLQWLGMKWDGEPVFQSHQRELHVEKIDGLVTAGEATRHADGSVTFHMPKEGRLYLNDRVQGLLVRDASTAPFDDYVIQRSDGSPTFLLANVVDDGEMGITHVIRGDDHVENAIRQLPLFKALGYEPPVFAHVALIHGDDGGKLSKRKNATSVMEYADLGYDPQVVANHFARLGSRFDTDEVQPLEELAKGLDPWGFSKSPSRIDRAKLNNRNRQYIRDEKSTVLEKAVRLCDPDLAERLGKPGLGGLIRLARRRADTLQEIVQLGHLIVEEPVRRDEDQALIEKFARTKTFRELVNSLEALPAKDWTAAGLSGIAEGKLKTNTKTRRALRLALTGVEIGAPANMTLLILGKAESLERLKSVSGS